MGFGPDDLAAGNSRQPEYRFALKSHLRDGYSRPEASKADGSPGTLRGGFSIFGGEEGEPFVERLSDLLPETIF